MRPARFHAFAATALAAAPEITDVQTWDGRTFGLVVTFTSGSRAWIGITGALPPGVKFADDDTPVQGDPPTAAPWPDLYDTDKAISAQRASAYMAAALTNTADPELAAAAPYEGLQNPGFSAAFHNGAKTFAIVVHTARPGQDKGTTDYRLQSTF